MCPSLTVAGLLVLDVDGDKHVESEGGHNFVEVHVVLGDDSLVQ